MSRSTKGAPLFEVRGLSFRRRGFVLGPLDLKLHAGELLILTGPAGAGKSTLLRLLALRERPDAGRLLHRQAPIPLAGVAAIAAWRRRLGIVDQQGLLLPDRSLREQMALLAAARGRRRAEARRDGMRVLTDLGLHALADRPCGQLSAGQQRWCQLGLALGGSPELLLLDEPLAQLPVNTRRELFLEIQRCCGRGAAALLCSHDEDLIGHGSARVLRLTEGRLAEERRTATRPQSPGPRGSA